MSVLRALLVFALVGPMASAAELKTLKGETIKGEIVSVSPKEIVIDSEGKKVTTGVDQILTPSFRRLRAMTRRWISEVPS